jgi:outer membrane protein assembly factor BamB
LKLSGHPVVLERDGRTVVVAPLGLAGVVAFEWSSRRELWRSPARFPVIASPALADFWGERHGYVVVGTTTGNVFVLDAREGRVVWHRRVAKGLIEADPVVADLDGDGEPDILVAAHDGFLHAVDGAASLGRRRAAR